MRIGRHMPLNGRPLRAIDIASQLGCETIQIFASNPTGWRPPAGGEQGAEEFARAAQARGLTPLVIHAPYLINLASPEPEVWGKSLALLTWTLRRAALLGAVDVVVHTGSHRGAGVEVGVARIAEALRLMLPLMPPTVRLLLENDVGAGHSLGHSFEHLAAVLRLLPEPEYATRLGICLDTAHLWGAGHNIGTPQGVAQVLQQVETLIGLQRLWVLHLNDTQKALGSHRDVHARLGEGLIPEVGLRALLGDERLAQVTVILETPIQETEDGQEDWEHDRRHLERAKALLTRR
jgi:deoxyribonuclease-4